MSRFLRPRRLGLVLGLAIVWCGLWRDLSVVNFIVGVFLSFLATAVSGDSGSTGGVRFRPLGRFVWLVLIDLVRSTIGVAAEILTPTDRTRESVVAVTLPEDGGRHLLLLTIAITMTPGTAVVETDRERATLYLHLLHHDRRPEAVTHAEELVGLACRALPARSAKSTGAST